MNSLKSGFKETTNWNKYHSKVAIERQKQYLDYIIDPGFQGVKRVFALSFENNAVRTGYEKKLI